MKKNIKERLQQIELEVENLSIMVEAEPGNNRLMEEYSTMVDKWLEIKEKNNNNRIKHKKNKS